MNENKALAICVTMVCLAVVACFVAVALYYGYKQSHPRESVDVKAQVVCTVKDVSAK